ncbi:hypothetical protein AVEN_43108-1, partial [Araneus ventricosus]
MAYLMPSSNNLTHLRERLKVLTEESGDQFSKEIMIELKNFNPFEKKNGVQFKDNLKYVVKKFQKKLDKKSNVRSAGNNIEDLKLAAVSKMLDCVVELFYVKSEEIENHTIFYPREQSVSSSVNFDAIVIFNHPDNQIEDRVEETFTCGIEMESCQKLQEKALNKILEKNEFL